jgi:hypothetical protein
MIMFLFLVTLTVAAYAGTARYLRQSSRGQEPDAWPRWVGSEGVAPKRIGPERAAPERVGPSVEHISDAESAAGRPAWTALDDLQLDRLLKESS